MPCVTSTSLPLIWRFVFKARTLNTVNKRAILKKYRKLALQLHPDKWKHALALDAMQARSIACHSACCTLFSPPCIVSHCAQ